MSNILTDALPDSITVGDQSYKLDTDFRTALKTLLAFEDAELTTSEKTSIMFDNLVDEETYEVSEELAIELIGFLNGGKPSEPDEDDNYRLYSLSIDAELIFAAFRQTHGIDLQSVSMHWWIFLALFMDLGADTAFCNLVSMRKRYQKGTLTKEERRAVADIKNFHLPNNEQLTLDELEAIDTFNKLASQKR